MAEGDPKEKTTNDDDNNGDETMTAAAKAAANDEDYTMSLFSFKVGTARAYTLACTHTKNIMW